MHNVRRKVDRQRADQIELSADNEMKLKQNSFKTGLKPFGNCFVSVSIRCADSFIVPHV